MRYFDCFAEHIFDRCAEKATDDKGNFNEKLFDQYEREEIAKEFNRMSEWLKELEGQSREAKNA